MKNTLIPYVFLLLAMLITVTSKSQTSVNGIKTLKEGILIVNVKTYTRQLDLLNQQLTKAKKEKDIQRILTQIEDKQFIVDNDRRCAQLAFEKYYKYGRYQVVKDINISKVRDSLEREKIPYLIFGHRNSAVEFGVTDANGKRPPSPFPRKVTPTLTFLTYTNAKNARDIKLYQDVYDKTVIKLNEKLKLLDYYSK